MKKHKIYLIIGIILLLMVIVTIAFIQYSLISNDYHKGFAHRQEMKLNETQIQGVKDVFNSTSNITEIKEYCHKERQSCIYYCRNINMNNSACIEMFRLIKAEKE